MARRVNRPARDGTLKTARDRLSLHPLSVEDALRGALATGKPPEQPKRKRTAAKRRLKDKDRPASPKV
jgi:hypothetical protein